MKLAKLTKAGGELIYAADADYPDYKGFLRCPNPDCNEFVFLRKAHVRQGIEVPAMFVHHKAPLGEATCTLRVSHYSREDVEASRSQARGQRLQKLTISLWKYIRQTMALDLKSWSVFVRDMKSDSFLRQVVDYGLEIFQTNQDFILNDTFPRLAKMLYERDPKIGISDTGKSDIDKFLKSRSRDWDLHCRIAQEALDLWLKSPAMAEVRHRLCSCLCHPTSLEAYPILLELDTATDEWRSQFLGYLTIEVVLVFLAVDWIAIWD